MMCACVLGIALSAAVGFGEAQADGTLYFTYLSSSSGLEVEPWLSGGPLYVGAPIAPGTYTIVVADPGAVDPSPNFELTGPGVDLTTTLGGATATSDSFSVTLAPSATYTFQDANPSVLMLGEEGAAQPTVTFRTSAPVVVTQATAQTVTTTPLATVTSTPPRPVVSPNATLGRIIAALGAGGKLTLTMAGKPVRTLTAGHYLLSLTGAAAREGLMFEPLGRNPLRLQGSSGYRIDFASGQWVALTKAADRRLYFVVEPTWA